MIVSQIELGDKIEKLQGIGPKRAMLLKKLGIINIEDLLFYYPRDYEDRRSLKKIDELVDGEIALLQCRADLIVKSPNRYGKKRTLRLLVSDDTGSLEVIFFNAAYLENTISKGDLYSIFGKVFIKDGRIQMIHPDFSKWEDSKSSGILPLYSLTQGISQNEMRKWVKAAMSSFADLPEFLPDDTIKRHRLCALNYAIHHIHFPEDGLKLKEAKFRLVFDELLILQTGLLLIRNKLTEEGNGICFSDAVAFEPFISSLPYELTRSQGRILDTLALDMEAPRVMSRLIQGDVGSGKTVLAAAAIYKAVLSGYQAVMMAPTDLLGKQHYQTMTESLQSFGIRIAYLSSAISTKARNLTLEQLKNGEIDLLIGTHALIQPTVAFNRLGLVITDEQHRFGVSQRNQLTRKGTNPDILVMTATPIPRTLAIILYGDLDISVLDEMPPDRKEILTRVITPEFRDMAYGFVREEILKGRQAYVVAPLIEDSESLDAKSAAGLYDELKIKFQDLRTALMHGELKQAEKDEIMERFNAGDIDVLISTVVIEVGINVPNATCMLIENAERFGLAQLHQLRGRVGRAEHQSTCFLITDAETDIARQRTQIMQETNDGFIIAEKDLDLRGPGEFFGTRQHGVPELKIANLIKHIKILETVRNEGRLILEADPYLSSEENKSLKISIENKFKDVEEFTL